MCFISYQILFITNIDMILPLNKHAREPFHSWKSSPNLAQHVLYLVSHVAPVAVAFVCLTSLAHFCSVSALPTIFSNSFPPATSPSWKMHSGEQIKRCVLSLVHSWHGYQFNPYKKLYATWPTRNLPVVAMVEVVVDVGIEVENIVGSINIRVS